jgi:hypothetical protein
MQNVKSVVKNPHPSEAPVSSQQPTAEGEQEDGRRPTADGGPQSAVRGHLLAVSGQQSESGSFNEKKMDFQITLQIDLRNGVDLKQAGATVARKVEGEIIKWTHSSLALSQAEMAAFFHVDPKTLRAKLKTGEGRGEG